MEIVMLSQVENVMDDIKIEVNLDRTFSDEQVAKINLIIDKHLGKLINVAKR